MGVIGRVVGNLLMVVVMLVMVISFVLGAGFLMGDKTPTAVSLFVISGTCLVIYHPRQGGRACA